MDCPGPMTERAKKRGLEWSIMSENNLRQVSSSKISILATEGEKSEWVWKRRANGNALLVWLSPARPCELGERQNSIMFAKVGQRRVGEIWAATFPPALNVHVSTRFPAADGLASLEQLLSLHENLECSDLRYFQVSPSQ